MTQQNQNQGQGQQQNQNQRRGDGGEQEKRVILVGSVKNLQAILETRAKTFAKLLPKHMTADRLIKIACMAASRNPDLVKCTASSFLMAMMQASETGLEPGGVMGDAYLVPRWNNKLRPAQQEVHFQPGYLGLLKLARQTDAIDFIGVWPVFEGDEFVYERNPMLVLRHKPDREHPEREVPQKLTDVWALAKLKGSTEPEEKVLSRQQIEFFRKFSQSPTKGPWVDHYIAMCLKTCLRQLLKFLPKSTRLERAMEIDIARDQGTDTDDGGMDFLPPSPRELPAAGEPAHDPQTGEVIDGGDPAPEINSGT